LGAGGMGVVYEGHDETLDRRVAVKVLHAERRLDPSARRRFLREARLLSRVEHPNICRVLEFVEGKEADFIVLELIEGRTLERAMEDGLSPEERWSVALQIAGALEVAHSLSIVHRDLKPSNIMLTADNTVKILDFGLARTVAGGGAEHEGERSGADEPGGGPEPVESLTRTGRLLGTPAYMSPEQARGEPVTAASDVYAFGLILHRLFTGTAPYGESAKPEELLRKAMWADTAPVTGVPRSLAELIGTLLELSPEDRPTAAACVERVRWIRDTPRRRLRYGAVAGAALVLVAASVVSSIGFVRARRAEQRATAVNSFLLDMLASADPAHRGRQVRVVDVLDDAAARVEGAFPGQPMDRAAVLLTLASTYDALGAAGKARPLAERALAIRRKALGEDAPATLAARDQLGVVLGHLGELERAESILREVVAARSRTGSGLTAAAVASHRHLAEVLEERGEYGEARKILEELIRSLDRAGPDRTVDAVDVRIELAEVMARQGDYEDAANLQRKTLETARSLLGERHPRTLAVEGDLAANLSRLGRPEEAEALFRRTVKLRTEVLGADHPDTLTALSGLGIVLAHRKRFEEAEEIDRRVLEARERTLGPDHPDTAAALGNLGVALTLERRYDEAGEVFRKAWKTAEAALGPEHPQTLMWMADLSTVLLRGGHPDRAVELARRVHAIDARVLGPDHPHTLSALDTVADGLWKAGRLDEAEPVYRELVQRSRRALGD
ncbi:MAG TPA: tetratricopeptide repeat protein, partial [Acidobacteria bacterium]|nr:tetratricopeptide repeat protein [Acidobacteriota bacterium]